MEDWLRSLLVDGSSLVIFVGFVLYLTKQQGEERKASTDVLMKVIEGRQQASQENMKSAVGSLDKVNGNIRELTGALVEMGKVMAAHDVRAGAGFDRTVSGLTTVIEKLDRITEKLMEGT